MKKKNLTYIILISSCVVLLVLFIVLILGRKHDDTAGGNKTSDNTTEEPTIVQDAFLTGDSIIQNFLTVNKYSRPGTSLNKVNGIVIHYVGNPGTSAANNRNYFENLKDTHERSASSHYIIGLEGEIIQCIPLDEISYASNDRNKDTIAIECCHPDETGEFNSATYESLVNLTAALCRTYGLNPGTDVLRHYDVTGKYCPLYFVENEDEWRYFLMQVNSRLK
ncbi:MAG: N-acetylmuramoyl-L-alanine amidase family protein [Butyrivibrio sp.]